MSQQNERNSTLALSEGRRTLDALVSISDGFSDDCIEVIKIDLLLASIFVAIVQLDPSISPKSLIASVPLLLSFYYAVTAYSSAKKFVGSSEQAVLQINNGSISESGLANDYSVWIQRTGEMNADLSTMLVRAWWLAFSSVSPFVALALLSS